MMSFEERQLEPAARKLRYSILLVLCSIFGGVLVASAADVQISIRPQLIGLLDRAELKVEFIGTKGRAIDFPEIEGLEIQYLGQSSETRIVNLKSSTKVVHKYLVTPSKTGDYTIGPVTARYKGGEKELMTRLRVIKKADDDEAQQLSEIMFSRITASRTSPYVQEPFGLELKVYVRDGIQIDGNFSIRSGIPESGLDGELQWNIADRERQEKNGSIFNVYTLKTTAKTLTAGMFSFRPEVQLNVVVPRQRRRSWGFDDPFFGDMFGRQETRPYTLDCNPLDIEVQPVPSEGRPGGFTGGVGVFDFNVEVAPLKVKAGEPITVKMRIQGNGNLTKITPPNLEDNYNFKLYDARTTPAPNPSEVRFEQVIIPKSETVTNIPPISFSYFNTRTADFRTITRGPFPVTVEAMPQQSAQVIAAVPGTVDQETRILGRDIVYLKPQPRQWKNSSDRLWYRTTLFNTLLPLPALLLILAAGTTARRRSLAGDVARARRQKAPKAARKHVALAQQAMRKGDASAFYEAMWNALTDYFGHRLNLAPGEVTRKIVLDRMPEGAGSVETLFDTVEQRRYGIQQEDAQSDGEMNSLFRQLTQTLKQCERMKL